MFEGKSLLQLLNMGGFTMYILLACSIVSIAVIINRMLYYRAKSRLSRAAFMERVRRDVASGSVDNALALCKKADTPFANVAMAGLKVVSHSEKILSNAMERETTIEILKLEKFTSVVGTIGNVAVYIGLFGTVLGIVRAFHDISAIGAGGINVVIGGVAEALLCTATGLLVAVPAVIAYNYFTKRIDDFINDMELTASELIDIINPKA
jgi:biopolymer transport protein ExbB